MELTCPKCQGSMRIYERNGVTVDQCTECRGLFLDRGELERLVDAEALFHESDSVSRVTAPAAPPAGYARPEVRYTKDDDDDEDARYRDGRYRENRYDDHYDQRRSKPKSFLQQLFD